MADSPMAGSNDLIQIIIHVVKGPWFSLFACLLVMCGAGAAYVFGTYSKEIKVVLGYDQTTLNLISFYKDLGTGVGIHTGLLAEILPVWAVLVIGAAFDFAGYFLTWMAVAGKIAKPKVWQMCVYIAIGANSQNFYNTAALVTAVKNFPESRGIMLGLLKGYAGLGGAVYTQLYLAIYGDDAKSLILLVAWLPSALSLLSVFVIREMKSIKIGNELKVFYHFLYVTIALALYIMAMTIAQKEVAFSKIAYIVSSIVQCCLLFVPLLISIRQETLIWKKKKLPPSLDDSSSVPQPSSSTKRELEKPTNSSKWYQNIFNIPKRGEDYTILQAILSTDMILLIVATFCGLGACIGAVNNMGQIGESQGYPNHTIQTFVSLISIWNFFGRVFSGYMSEYLLSKYGFPRTLMITLVLLTSCFGQLMIAFPFATSLYIASIIIGFSFGALYPLMSAIVSELFGLKYYSTLSNWSNLSLPLGSYVMNVWIAGPLYDKEAKKYLARKGISRSPGQELVCLGNHCFQLVFVSLAAITFFGAIISLILVARTRGFYKGDIYNRYKDEVEVVAETEITDTNRVHHEHEI